jgi:hypothetical protein
VQIADDGKGIDWSAVAAKAAELGLPHDGDKDLLEALFANGVSTSVEVESRKEKGTVVTFGFPASAAGVASPATLAA